MVYMGSKSKYANIIVPILQKIIDTQSIQCYCEPFVGGANIIDKIKCKRKIGLDKNYSLIKLHQKAQTNPEEIPSSGNSDWWYAAKDIYRKHFGASTMEEDMEGWRVGAIQILGSFNNGGFSRGYAKPDLNGGRDKYNEAYKNLINQAKEPGYKEIEFECCEYELLSWPEEIKTLFYCDPPYQGTKPYGYSFETKFNYDNYWEWVRRMSKNHIVICSEQTFPDDFEIIWEAQVKRTVNKMNDFKAVEKLGIWRGTDKLDFYLNL